MITGRGENPPPEFHFIGPDWPIKMVLKFVTAFCCLVTINIVILSSFNFEHAAITHVP